MGAQPDWRWCSRCSTLAYAGFGTGVCVSGQGHDFGGSGEYLVAMQETPQDAQPGWRWCSRCQCLAYSEIDSGSCAAGGGHDFTGSGAYSVPMGPVPGGAQEGWRWCGQCQCLVYGGGASPGSCPAGDEHYFGGSGAYSVSMRAVDPVDPVDPKITVDTGFGDIRIEGTGFSANSAVHIRFQSEDKTLDIDTTANQAGRILHREDGRQQQGRCNIIVRDTATGRWTLDAVLNRVPQRFPRDPVTIDPGTALGDDGYG
jgi:hypothetical protein